MRDAGFPTISPVYISGEVQEQRNLMETPIGVVRDPEFFQKVKDIKALNRTEAISIDHASKEVEVRSLEKGDTYRLPYDKLIIATGSKPFIPPIEGIDSEGVYTLQGVEDAEALRASWNRKRPKTWPS